MYRLTQYNTGYFVLIKNTKIKKKYIYMLFLKSHRIKKRTYKAVEFKVKTTAVQTNH